MYDYSIWKVKKYKISIFHANKMRAKKLEGGVIYDPSPALIGLI